VIVGNNKPKLEAHSLTGMLWQNAKYDIMRKHLEDGQSQTRGNEREQ
jgi:hypothetical protein